MAERRGLQSGMTMIEILVVLSVIATAASMVMLSLPNGSTLRSAQQEAELLVARLNIAAERSLVESRMLRMSWSSEGYGFEEWQQDAWQAVEGLPLSAPHRLDRYLVLSDVAGAGRGSIIFTPDLLPPDEGVVDLFVRGASGEMRVSFDGYMAWQTTDVE